MKAIVATGRNREIGKDNQLLWHIPDDLKRFKKLTSGQTVIMGRKTFESIGKPLPNRRNVILSRNTTQIDDCLVYNNIEDVLELFPEAWVIGGSEIYKILLNHIDEIYLTLVYDEFPDADAFFPEYLHRFKEDEREDHDGYSYIKLIRK